MSVVRRSRTAAAIVAAVGAVLAASGFPATAATGSSDLTSGTTSTSGTSASGTTSTSVTSASGTTSTSGTSASGTTSTSGTSASGTSASNKATGTTASGTTAGDSPTGSASADTTTVTTGQTLLYNEGATGYCTWWAITEFHAYTGLFPDFFDSANNGNAEYWATDAAYNGWTVTGTPRVASIAVFPPGVNGAEPDGHVAWVAAISGPQITISEMNGPAGWNEVDTRTITPGSSVSYILAP